MKLQPAELVLIRMQFHQAQGSKIRPALVLLDTGDEDFVAAPITSRSKASDFDFVLTDWRGAGLNVPSIARINKLTVLAKSEIVRRIGVCSIFDHANLSRLLCSAFCP